MYAGPPPPQQDGYVLRSLVQASMPLLFLLLPISCYFMGKAAFWYLMAGVCTSPLAGNPAESQGCVRAHRLSALELGFWASLLFGLALILLREQRTITFRRLVLFSITLLIALVRVLMI